MQAINEYRILEASDRVRLSELVTNCIGNGWRPYGSLVITVTDDNDEEFAVFYTQAMVR